jgi:hypothetical protein
MASTITNGSWSVNAVARYEWAAFGGKLSAEVDAKWNKELYLELINAPVDPQPSTLKAGSPHRLQAAALGIAIAISGNVSGWNYGLGVGGWGGMLLAALAMAVLRVHRDGYHTDAALDSEFVWMRALQAAAIRIPPPRLGRRRAGGRTAVVGAVLGIGRSYARAKEPLHARACQDRGRASCLRLGAYAAGHRHRARVEALPDRTRLRGGRGVFMRFIKRTK